MKKFQTVKGLLICSLLIFGVSIFALSCSNDDSKDSTAYVCTTCNDTPDALAVNDASVKGIYKGVVVGSTGTLSIDIQNGSSTITAVMVLDGDTIELTSTVSVVDDEPYIAPFTGTYNGDPISITFSVELGGELPTIVTSSIPGHPNATFQIAKETSTSLIEAFEGSYKINGTEKGVFNIILSSALGKFGGVTKENETGEINEDVEGNYLSNGQITDSDGNVLGTITGDELNGSFRDNNNDLITITGKRTL